MKLSIVIPAYNEEDSVSNTVVNLHSVLSDHDIRHELLVVNDNSTDNTLLVLQDLQHTIDVLRVFDNPPPNGFGFAIRCGLEKYSGDAVAIYMADGSDSPEDLVTFFETMQVEDVECVFGTRFTKESKVVDYPKLKLPINRMANWFIRVLFGLRYNDITNALKLYRREVIEGVQPILSHHFNITVELPLKAITRGYSYSIVPNSWFNRKMGVSKLKIAEMGSRYLFIILYCLIEKLLSKGDYHRSRQAEIETVRKDHAKLAD